MRALVSVSDRTGLIDLARALHARGVELVSTGGTGRALAAAGLPVVPVADLTGVPELLDGRVKTLHPAVHAGILARRDRPDDLDALARHGIRPIDLVVVNLYPFERAAAAGRPAGDLLEEIDIGGPTLVRAAAKNFRDVLVVVDPGDYARLVAELDRPGGPSPAFRLELARKAFTHTAAYDRVVAGVLGTFEWDERGLRRGTDPPASLDLTLSRVRALRYGENPHQPGVWYAERGAGGFAAADVLQGRELSFTNLLDLDAAARLVLEFAEPAAAVIKHTNPCGVAIGATAAEAYTRARDADPLSAFGGIVGLNRPVDVEAARALTSTFIEAVVAPGVAPEARALLAVRPNLRVVVADFAPFAARRGRELRSIAGGVLVQERDAVEEARAPWPAAGLRVVTRRAPTPEEWEALRFAWRVCAHVRSNAVVFAARDRTLAVGAGQMSRVDAVKVAVMKGGAALAGSVAASDAFFPFRDGLDAIAAAGATAVVQPGGSVRDAEVIAAADEHGLAMVFTGIRHFRH
ncbi:MAG TPA: bifunctional phosphoribosylaminoimidazolecarboxamide formyltransferase/IMP cyclohydrolase [Vicinamibacterales bacterium]|nr:bifunctional phosphoribosylaminoimidazolecarboxamide formyltransferase/IMP cyclohydrolase [Vicinamibacterales bacterium]